MIRRAVTLSATLVLSLAFAASATAITDARSDRTLNFDVFLDDSKIGYHRFEFRPEGDSASVYSEANFKVRFLFVTAFRYEHSTAERWVDGCLAELEATTDSNGNKLAVSGERNGAAFVVNNGERTQELPACVMTFAYWNPAFLEQPRLLNPQTGEYLDVTVETLEPATIEIQGSELRAKRYRLTAKDMDLTVWYSDDDRWLALESVAKGGRIIRYELS